MLIEIRKELVRQEHQVLEKRYLQDSQNRMTIYIWQLPGDAPGEMLKFQISYKEDIFEWSAQKGLRCGLLDEGDNPMGMKRAPILMMADSIDAKAAARVSEYLQSLASKPDLNFILTIIQSAKKVGLT